MNNAKISFVFFGSGPVAAENLAQLAEQFEIEAIVTKPTTEQEMHAACPEAPVYCVSNKHELDTLITEKQFTSTVGVLIDFGIIVSQKVIDYFANGIVNSHFSLLPQWRGADPITFSLLSGQERTGVSLMLLVEAMDEGPIIGVGVYDIKNDDTTPLLTQSLIALSTSLLTSYLPKYLEGSITPASQIDVAQSLGMSTEPSYSRKLTKEDGRVDWRKSAVEIEREIRAYAGWPKSFAKLGSVDVVLLQAAATKDYSPDDEVGKIEYLKKDSVLRIACHESSLLVRTLKPTGKKEMPAQAFVAGYSSRIGL